MEPVGVVEKTGSDDAPIASPSDGAGGAAGDYGACDTKSSSGFYNGMAVLSTKGDPWTLLVANLAETIPIIAPLLLVIQLNYFTPPGAASGWIMMCDGHSFPVFAACSLSVPMVRLFPLFALVSALVLMGWRMTHERAYYVLMQHRIVVDFENGPRLGFFMVRALAVVFLVVVLNFLLTITYGHPHEGEDYIKEPLSVIISSSLQDPMHIVKANPDLLPYVLLISVKYIVPGVLTLIFFLGLDGIEARLITLNEYLEDDRAEGYRLLGNTIFAPEEIMAEVIEEGLTNGKDGKSATTMAELCQELSERLLEYDGVAIVNSPPLATKVERKDSKLVSKKHVHSVAGFVELLRQTLQMDWWPVQLLMNRKFADPESISFKRAVGLYFVIAFIITFAIVLLCFKQVMMPVAAEFDRWGLTLPLFPVLRSAEGPSIETLCLALWLATCYSVSLAIFVDAARHMLQHCMNVLARACDTSMA